MRFVLPLNHPAARFTTIGAIFCICACLLYAVLCEFIVGALADAGQVEVHNHCGGVIGYDAWVDSNDEVCGGPFDDYVCMKCGESNPSDVTRGEPEAD